MLSQNKTMKENLLAKEKELDLWIEEYNKLLEEKSIEGKDSEEEGIEERSIEPSLIDRNTIWEMLRRRTGLEVVMWDERLTTASAERTLIETGIRRENRKQYVDQIAAVFILQGFLDSLAMKQNPDEGDELYE